VTGNLAQTGASGGSACNLGKLQMKNLKTRAAAAGALLFPLVASATVTLPTAFTAAITDATEQGVGMAELLLGVAAAVVVVMLGIKFIKRIRGAA